MTPIIITGFFLIEVNQVCEAERRVHIAEERAIEAERLSAGSWITSIK